MPRTREIAAAILCSLIMGVPAPKQAAQEIRAVTSAASPIQVTGHWTRAALPGAPSAAAYMELHNRGAEPDRLTSAASPEARAAELHETHEENGIARMRPVAGGLVLPPGATARLALGRLHLMLLGPSGVFRQGAVVPLVLRFERAGEIRVELPVLRPGARGPAPAGAAGHPHGGH